LDRLQNDMSEVKYIEKELEEKNIEFEQKYLTHED